jgi:hypothetical protein
MTKYLILVGQILLIGCGQPGANSTVNNPVTGNPPGLDNSCKAFRSAWQSTSDNERHDFTNVVIQARPTVGSPVFTDYSYIGFDGSACPQPGQPSQIAIYDGPPAVTSIGFHYMIEFKNNFPSVGCANWQDGSTGKHGSAIVKVECNKVTLCQGVNLVECKEFQ